MRLPNFLQKLTRNQKSRKQLQRRRDGLASLSLELLEDRLAPATLGQWSFDTDFTDSSGFGNGLSVIGSVSIVSQGVKGSAASFAGSDSCLATPPLWSPARPNFPPGRG